MTATRCPPAAGRGGSRRDLHPRIWAWGGLATLWARCARHAPGTPTRPSSENRGNGTKYTTEVIPLSGADPRLHSKPDSPRWRPPWRSRGAGPHERPPHIPLLLSSYMVSCVDGTRRRPSATPWHPLIYTTATPIMRTMVGVPWRMGDGPDAPNI